jgi:ribokinase
MGNVCVVGSLNTDLVAFADRHPLIGETVTGSAFEVFAGGKGLNQAVAAARAGAAVSFIGAVGHDSFGDDLLAVLSDADIDLAFVARSERGTGVAHIVVNADGDNSIVVVPNANGTVTPAQVRASSHLIEAADVLLLQFELPMDAVEEAARIAKAAGTTVVLNPAPATKVPEALLGTVDVIIPNETEAATLAGVEGSAKVLAEVLFERYQLGATLITLGDDGVLVATQDAMALIPAFSVEEVVDTTGAGDCFCGNLAAALSEDKSLDEAATWATAAAGLSVQEQGAAPSMPMRSATEALLR